jgi:hypothetical protein
VRYLFLLWGDEAAELALDAAQRRAIVEAHGRFLRSARETDPAATGEPLGGAREGLVVVPGGSVTDGPFLETKEQLGGFYLIDCADRDAAVRLAREIPASPGLRIEIRPIPD